MKKLPFVQRLRESPASVLVPIAPAESRRPFRLWMTGSLAVVMAAMIPLRDVSVDEREHTMRVLRHSRFDVTETVQRIEAAARVQGLSVLALMSGARPVLVLASSVGGTPVLMHEADSRPAMPLSLMVREGGRGGADVLVAAASVAHASQDWHELPAAVLDDLYALPGLVERALR
jgi:uncharacterized protein (DUF302 family)